MENAWQCCVDGRGRKVKEVVGVGSRTVGLEPEHTRRPRKNA